jgi:hypothetical protein
MLLKPLLGVKSGYTGGNRHKSMTGPSMSNQLIVRRGNATYSKSHPARGPVTG